MSTQSPQTGGKISQPGQAGGKGMAGGAMDAIAQQMPQQMSQQMPQQMSQQMLQMPNQADGNNQMGNPMPSVMMGQQLPDRPTDAQAQAMGLGSAGGKGTAGMGQGNVTYPSQSGQPMMGMPNAYSNTLGNQNDMTQGYKNPKIQGSFGSNGKSGV